MVAQSASICCIDTWSPMMILLLEDSSQRKKTCDVLCFVLDLYVGLPTTCNTPVLPQLIDTELKDLKPFSTIKMER